MGTVQIKGRIPDDVAALFDLAVDVMAQTTQAQRRHRGGVTRTVAFTQNAAVIAAISDWTDTVLALNPQLALQLAADRLADPDVDRGKREALQQGLCSAGLQ